MIIDLIIILWFLPYKHSGREGVTNWHIVISNINHNFFLFTVVGRVSKCGKTNITTTQRCDLPVYRPIYFETMIPKWTLFWVPNSKIWFQLYTNLNSQPLCWENQPLCTGVHYCALAHYTLLAFIIHREWAGLHARLRFLYALFKGAYHTQWGGIDSEVVVCSIFIQIHYYRCFFYRFFLGLLYKGRLK